MKAVAGTVATTAFLILSGCSGGDAESPGAAAPDVSSETTPAPVPLPPETEPLNPDSGLVPAPAVPADTTL